MHEWLKSSMIHLETIQIRIFLKTTIISVKNKRQKKPISSKLWIRSTSKCSQNSTQYSQLFYLHLKPTVLSLICLETDTNFVVFLLFFFPFVQQFHYNTIWNLRSFTWERRMKQKKRREKNKSGQHKDRHTGFT